MSVFATNSRKMAEIAQQILDGRTTITVGARTFHSLCCGHVELDESDPDIRTFVGFDSESHDLPIGDVRQYWAPDALARKDAERLQLEAEWQDRVFKAASNLIAKFTPDT